MLVTPRVVRVDAVRVDRQVDDTVRREVEHTFEPAELSLDACQAPEVRGLEFDQRAGPIEPPTGLLDALGGPQLALVDRHCRLLSDSVGLQREDPRPHRDVTSQSARARGLCAMNERDWLAGEFEEHRQRLTAVAYRMLGSTAEADDAVQEAWLRLNRSDSREIVNLEAWLVTVVGRIALNMLRSRSMRSEDPLDMERLPDPVVDRPGAVDPEHEALIADSVGLALLVVLETLTPAERLAYVLHDMFSVSFVDIGAILERSPDAARQLASRGRRRIRGADPIPDSSPAAQQEVVDAFLAAARDGDFNGLVAVLDPDVVERVDLGSGTVLEVRGNAEVASRAQSVAQLGIDVRRAFVNGVPGWVSLLEGEVVAIAAITVQGGRIASMDILADRERLGGVDVSALEL